MFIVTKRMEISASHNLNLPYESKCSQLHGHNWIIDVEISAEILDDVGMVMDFTHIKKVIYDRLDHRNLNQVFSDLNPTAENIAKWIADELADVIHNTNDMNYPLSAKVTKVTVQESEGNTACYIP